MLAVLCGTVVVKEVMMIHEDWQGVCKPIQIQSQFLTLSYKYHDVWFLQNIS